MTSTNQRSLQLRFPAENGYLRVSRLTATTLAADLGFDVDALDDLRLAVAEAVNYLVESSTAEQVVLQLVADLDGFRLEGITADGNEEPVRATGVSGQTIGLDDSAVDDSAVDDGAVDDLLHAVLGATTDDYRIGVVDNRRYVRLVKSVPGVLHADPTASIDTSTVGTNDRSE